MVTFYGVSTGKSLVHTGLCGVTIVGDVLLMQIKNEAEVDRVLGLQ